jgi:diguanylate cyclase (GGDEF)-like protein/PAS domain S-box-containing protein
MRFPHIRSIRAKLSFLIALNSSIALLLAGGSLLAWEAFQFRAAATTELTTLSRIIGDSATGELSFADERAARESLAALRADRRLVQAALYDRNHRLFAQYQNPGYAPSVIPQRSSADGVYIRDGFLLLFQPVKMGGERIGTIFLKSSMDEVTARLRHYAGIVCIVLLVSLGLALMLGSTIQGAIANPLAALAGVAHRVSAEKNYSIRASKSTEGEIGLLIDSFNHMLAEIEARDAARRKAEDSLRESEERYALAARGANDGLWDWKLTTNEIYFSPRWTHMLGYREGEIPPDPEEWFIRIHPSDAARVRSALESHCLSRTPEFACEYRMRHKNGNYVWILSRGIAVRDAAGTAVRIAGSQTDITEGKVADPLTELPNRVYFLEKLEGAVEAARYRDRPFAVLFIDLDRFKLINDSQGHAAGDQLLMGVAQRIRASVRETDSVRMPGGRSTIARLGGDEFAILLEGARRIADAEMVAERILKQLASPFSVDGREVFVTVSVGIALSSSGSSPSEMLRNADTAMYHAKARGKARFEVFDESMRVRAVARLEIESDLRRALHAQEFVLHYQPRVLLRSRRVAGFEALVRWNHPRKGMIPPGDFISIAEETKSILPLGRWVLREACRQLADWQRTMKFEQPLSIGVNISFRQLTEPGLEEEVDRILAETGLDPASLKLEMTESSVMENAATVIATLERLKNRGVGLEIDDFGTGYSSLSYLRRLPFDTVKIDRSFVSEIDGKHENSEIINTIVQLAASLRMEVIAEGIETREQAATLVRLGCDYGQGYYFSRPVDAERAWKILQEMEPHQLKPYLLPAAV